MFGSIFPNLIIFLALASALISFFMKKAKRNYKCLVLHFDVTEKKLD